MSTNNYLIRAINEFENSTDDRDATRRLMNFINELKVSNLYVPAVGEDDDLVFETLILEDNERVCLPLFTGEEEFYKCYDKSGEYEPLENEFEIYGAIASEDAIDGIVIDPESLCFDVPGPVIDMALEDFSLSFDGIPTRSAEEIRQVYENISNDDIISFIEDDSNADDFEGIMVELSYANMLNLVVSDEPLEGFGENGMIKADDVGGFTLCSMQDEDACCAMIFTGTDAIGDVISQDGESHYYAQLTRVSEIFEFVLRNDMDGVIIDPNGSEFFIPRSAVLTQASGITIVPEDASFRNCLDYAFVL